MADFNLLCSLQISFLSHLSFSEDGFVPCPIQNRSHWRRQQSHAQELTLGPDTIENLKEIPICWSSKGTSRNAAWGSRRRPTQMYENNSQEASAQNHSNSRPRSTKHANCNIARGFIFLCLANTHPTVLLWGKWTVYFLPLHLWLSPPMSHIPDPLSTWLPEILSRFPQIWGECLSCWGKNWPKRIANCPQIWD